MSSLLSFCLLLQEEDLKARHFHFRKKRDEIHWQAIHSTDLETITLAEVEEASMKCSIGHRSSKGCTGITPTP